jgi:hypothetical protein
MVVSIEPTTPSAAPTDEPVGQFRTNVRFAGFFPAVLPAIREFQTQ